jgi:hypothetical protein
VAFLHLEILLKRLIASGLLLLVGPLVVSIVLAQDGQWTRQQIDGRQVCVNPDFPDHPFVPSYESPSFVTVSCNVSNQMFAWIEAALGVSAAEALSLGCQINFDGTCDSSFPRGDKPQGAPDGAYDESSYGTSFTVCETSEDIDGTGDAQIQTDLSARADGFCGLVLPIATAVDGRATADIVSASGANTYRGGHASIADTQDNTGNRFSCYQPAGSNGVRAQRFVNGVQTLSTWSGELTALPKTPTAQYDYSTETATCLYWDGMEWAEVDTWTATDLFTEPYYVGIGGESDTPSGNTATVEFENVVLNSTLVTVGDPDPPPEPPPAQDTYSDDYDDTTTAGGAVIGERSTTNVSNASQLASAMTGAACGTDIQMAAGTYNAASWSFNRSCPATNPVILHGAANFGSTISGGVIAMTGARNIITGVRFSGSSARVSLRGTNNKLIANRFTNWSGNAIAPSAETSPGTQGEIAYNEIFSPANWASVTCPSNANQSRFGIRMNTAGSGQANTVHHDVWVHHNWFYDFPNKPCSNYSSGQSDAIEPCESNYDWTATTSIGWMIENNLIENHAQSGQAAIDMKCGGAVIRFNTLRDISNMRFDARYGAGNIFEGNYITSGGTVLNSANHSVVCNFYGAGLGIRLVAGNQEWNYGASAGGTHNRVQDALVANNEAPLLRVGHQYDGNSNLATLRTEIWEHTGSITFGLHSNTSNNSGDTWSGTCGEPSQLSDSQVGPQALPNAATAYLEARGLD